MRFQLVVLLLGVALGLARRDYLDRAFSQISPGQYASLRGDLDGLYNDLIQHQEIVHRSERVHARKGRSVTASAGLPYDDRSWRLILRLPPLIALVSGQLRQRGLARSVYRTVRRLLEVAKEPAMHDTLFSPEASGRLQQFFSTLLEALSRYGYQEFKSQIAAYEGPRSGQVFTGLLYGDTLDESKGGEGDDLRLLHGDFNAA